MITSETLQSFLQTNWGWAAGLAASMLGLTLLAGSLLNPVRKDEIALWLMGAQSEENWSRSFTSLFDAVFGERHLSLRCFLRSAVASLIAVMVIWLLMGNLGTLGLRIRSELSLGTVLVLALAVNVIADYLSLLETRLLLGQMPRSALGQALVLVLDLALSAAIIWLAIFAFLRSPLNEGEIETFAEILGLFSIFSVLFYSTFLTSVWTWAYILSTWVMRAFARLRLAALLDVEKQPIRILGLVLAGIVFAGALVLSVPLRKNSDGLTVADRALCSVFKGRVCLDVVGLTTVEKAQLELVIFACEGGLTEECLGRGQSEFNIKPEHSARLWAVSCQLGDALSCGNLGFLRYAGKGIGLDVVEAARLLRLACNGGAEESCANLGHQFQFGEGVNLDLAEAALLYRRSCDGGSSFGCNNLGNLYSNGLGLESDPVEAVRLFRMSCANGYAGGCVNLGIHNEFGKGIEPDEAEAARLYQQGCGGGDPLGCTQLGRLHEKGIGMDPDPIEAARLYRQGCDGGHARGCFKLGWLFENGIGVDTDPAEAAGLYRQACDGGSMEGCNNLGDQYENGRGVEQDPAEAGRLYRQACDGGDATGCFGLGDLSRKGIGMALDPVMAARYYRQACDMGDREACVLADELD